MVGTTQSRSSGVEAADRIAALEARLGRQARERAELVHLVSHELRTPITVIAGFSRLLMEEGHGALGPDQQRFVAEIQRACRRLDAFVGDLLDAGTDAETPFVVVPRPTDLHELLTGQLETFAPLLEERSMKLEARLHASEPTVDIDPTRIEQVVTNLMSNAIRYGRHAGVIRLATSDGASGCRTGIEVAVEDDGPGIALADRERLFAPYVRGAAGAEASGLGIGLAICRRIVAAHGGRIRAEASPLGGARFVFELPGSDAETAAAGEE